MKQLIRVLFLFAVLLLMIAPTFAQGEVFQVTENQINVRSGPGIEYEVLGLLYKGYGFPVVAYSPTGNWVQLNINGTHGWVFRGGGEVHLASAVMYAPSTSTTTTTTTTYTAPVYTPPVYTPPVNTYDHPVYTVPVMTQAPTQVNSNYINSTVGVTKSLNIRRGPSLYAGILTVIPYDERAVPLARTADATWILINYKGTVGWVYHAFVAFPPAISVVKLPVQ